MIKKYDRLKVLGTRHCFNNIADSKDHLISVSHLKNVVKLDKDNMTVTIEAGVRYGDLAVYLHNQGYALHNLASLPHISVVGGCATATHGSGVSNGNLSSAVRAMEVITASGEKVVFSGKENKEQFPGAVVHLGGLGVVTAITLAIQPTFQVKQQVFEELPFKQLSGNFDKIMSAGYSVSLFTDWRNESINEVWVKSKAGEEIKASTGTDFFGARPATRDLHPIKSMPAENCTEQMGIPGPWYERLPHFRMGFTPSSGVELQSEYFVPNEHAYDAIATIAKLNDRISPLLQISEIRSIAADDLWMSPCYHKACTTIHFTWKQEIPAVMAVLPLIEEKLAPFGARPHWGKLFTLSPGKLEGLYEKLPEFRQLLKQYDPKGKFRNDYLDTIIFNSRGTRA